MSRLKSNLAKFCLYKGIFHGSVASKHRSSVTKRILSAHFELHCFTQVVVSKIFYIFFPFVNDGVQKAKSEMSDSWKFTTFFWKLLSAWPRNFRKCQSSNTQAVVIAQSVIITVQWNKINCSKNVNLDLDTFYEQVHYNSIWGEMQLTNWWLSIGNWPRESGNRPT